MVPLKSLAAFLALGVLSTTAAPANSLAEAKALAGRQNTVNVYACEHTDWRGACQTFNSVAGSCCESKLAPTSAGAPKQVNMC